MKCFTICVFVFALAVVARADEDLVASASENSENTQELSGSASSLSPWQEKHQEKRYVGGYAGVGGYGTGLDAVGGYGSGYYNPYQSKLGLDGYAGYPGYNGYSGGYGGYGGYSGQGGYGGYGGYTGGYTGGYNSYPYNSYYNRLSGAYPYARPGYGGYGSYPSSYYSSNYGNSVIGGGLGALGTPGFVPPVSGAAGYQYGPGISGTVY
ncbi:keratin-associated protein 19-2 [Calliphora vicina]|uniref:keratin-associated protein 19-2 n=1 Tax=Calliphora vicina TaxID=7373 RepID=UPI00325B108D